MSALSGVNYTLAYVNVPAERPNTGDYGGSVKVIIDSVAGAIAADTVNIGKLPNRA